MTRLGIDIVSPYGVILCRYPKRFTFSLKASFSQLCPRFLIWDFARFIIIVKTAGNFCINVFLPWVWILILRLLTVWKTKLPSSEVNSWRSYMLFDTHRCVRLQNFSTKEILWSALCIWCPEHMRNNYRIYCFYIKRNTRHLKKLCSRIINFCKLNTYHILSI